MAIKVDLIKSLAYLKYGYAIVNLKKMETCLEAKEASEAFFALTASEKHTSDTSYFYGGLELSEKGYRDYKTKEAFIIRSPNIPSALKKCKNLVNTLGAVYISHR